jgi:NAD(P)-dependent dehydrogenase (short-subunit alcohol dehydrogenase family)
VYVTGRSTRAQRSEYDRPETIEETAELVSHAGGHGIAVQVDHLDVAQVQALAARIDQEQGRLDLLVNDIWGGELLFEWNKSVWEHSLERGLRLLRLSVDTHLITNHIALPLLIRQPGGLVVEMTDGTADYNAQHYRVSHFYDLAKASVLRMAWSLAHELRQHGATAVALTPGWLRSEMMLAAFGVTEENWRDATVHQPLERAIAIKWAACEGVWLCGSGRIAARCLALRPGSSGRRQASRCYRLPVIMGELAAWDISYHESVSLYPTPRTVVINFGRDGSSSTFSRRRRTHTSTRLVSPT